MNPMDIVKAGEGIKKLLELTNTIADTAKRLEAVDTITNLQQALLSSKADNDQLRMQHFEFQKEILELKSQIRDYEDWNKTKEQYQLVQQPHGVSLYVHKVNKSKACTTCMGKKLESILQPGIPGCWSCHVCQQIFKWEPHRVQRPDYGRTD